MFGVGETVQQADGDGLDAEAAAGFGGFGDGGFVEFGEHHAAGADALDHFEDARGRDRAPRLDPGVEIGTARDVLAADVEHMAEALGGDEGGAGAFAFEDEIGGDRGAVEDAGDRGFTRASRFEGEADAGEEGLAGVGGGGLGFGAPGAAGGGVLQGDVGEGAADVDRD